MRVRSGDTVATFSFDQIESGFERAEARFEGLTPPLRTFAVRVFADEPHPNAQTPTDGNLHYLGTQNFYGLGVPDAAPDPSDPSDPYALGRTSQSAPTMVPLNITQRFRDYLAQAKPHAAPLTLVAVDRTGAEIPDPGLEIEGFSIVTR